MKIVIAPDSFKSSLSSSQIISIIRKRAHEYFPNAELVEVPIADGGDGTVEAVVAASHGTIISTQARDPHGRVIDCIYGKANDAAIIGISECSGLALLTQQERNPLLTSTHGVGDLIKKALDDGIANIYLGIGGSATNDAGTGALQALGLKFLRKDGSEILRMCGKELIHVAKVDSSNLDPRIAAAKIIIMCDVTNPLTGTNGATYIYGPQKGGTPPQLAQLEAGMQSFEEVLNKYAGKNISTMPGTGAAGGIGCGLVCFADAVLTSGIEAMLNLVNFSKTIQNADLIITGEGRVDSQSAFGKVVHGVAKYAKAADIPVVVIAGSIGSGAQVLYELGINTLIGLPEAPITLNECIQNAQELLRKTADRVFSLIKIGKNLP
jgi:glycerate kinase